MKAVKKNENPEKARDFGLPYIVVREPRPYDTATLNYNWQIWETDAYSVYSGTTAHISEAAAELAADAVERFMVCSGILNGTPADAAPSRIFRYDDLCKVCTAQAGLFRSLAELDGRVRAGQPLAEVIDPCTGEVLETLRSPADGVAFFRYSDPLVYAHTTAYKILRDAE